MRNQKQLCYTGRSGRLHVARDGTSLPVQVVRLTDWELKIERPFPDLSCTFRGYWDDPDGVLETAMMSPDGTKIILYPSDKDEPYASGPAWLDLAPHPEDDGTRSGLFQANGSWLVEPSLAAFAALVVAG